MIGNSLITQIIIAAVAIGIIITYIQPTLGNIRSTQDEITQTRTELQNINEVNSRLAQLVSEVNSISSKDKEALADYMPEELDEVRVMKDITAIAEAATVILSSLTYGGFETMRATDSLPSLSQLPMVHRFSINFLASYEQTKRFLLLLEKNKYPLDIQTLSINPDDGGLLEVSFVLATYSHK